AMSVKPSPFTSPPVTVDHVSSLEKDCFQDVISSPVVPEWMVTLRPESVVGFSHQAMSPRPSPSKSWAEAMELLFVPDAGCDSVETESCAALLPDTTTTCVASVPSSV